MTEEDCELKGMGSGPSPPTYPLANSFRAVEDLTEAVGEKALADPASAARVKINLVMVDRQLLLLPGKMCLGIHSVPHNGVISTVPKSYGATGTGFYSVLSELKKDLCSTKK